MFFFCLASFTLYVYFICMCVLWVLVCSSFQEYVQKNFNVWIHFNSYFWSSLSIFSQSSFTFSFPISWPPSSLLITWVLLNITFFSFSSNLCVSCLYVTNYHSVSYIYVSYCRISVSFQFLDFWVLLFLQHGHWFPFFLSFFLG